MTDAPNRIWAWKWNAPGKHHGKETWADFEPRWPKPVKKWVDEPGWNPFAGHWEECRQEVTEYVRADSALDLLIWIEDNAHDDFWERIPIDLWNKVTVV